ncbi:MAG: hypothetical protein HOY75_33390 [Streptomyces sp.]|nr:hypothetical protein [Streptomyces sp.]
MSRAVVGVLWAGRAVVWSRAGPGGLVVRPVPAVSADRDGLAASRVPVVRAVLAVLAVRCGAAV